MSFRIVSDFSPNSNLHSSASFQNLRCTQLQIKFLTPLRYICSCEGKYIAPASGDIIYIEVSESNTNIGFNLAVLLLDKTCRKVTNFNVIVTYLLTQIMTDKTAPKQIVIAAKSLLTVFPASIFKVLFWSGDSLLIQKISNSTPNQKHVCQWRGNIASEITGNNVNGRDRVNIKCLYVQWFNNKNN